jgi:hypothetical protein
VSDDQIRTILVAIAEVKAEVRAVRSDNDRGDAIHADHETRLRALERVRWMVAGAALLVGSGLGALATQALGG